MKRFLGIALLASTAALLVPRPASATFHVMQIEQVIAGVDGNNTVQAIQLRMRTTFQNQMQNARLNVRDATGANPVLLIDFTTPVAVQGTGVRVLAATSNFSSHTSPAVTPDYVLANPIPPSYLAAGSLTFEDDFGTIYWRLSWGGAGYTGTGAGSITNDADGNFNPPTSLTPPTASNRALIFPGAATAPSTNNAADYSLTAVGAVVTNNAGQSGQIQTVVGVGDPPVATRPDLGLPIPNPARGAFSFAVTLTRPGHATVRAYDPRGRLVRTVVDRDLPAGSESFTWDVVTQDPNLADGIYLLVLEAEGQRQVRRVAYLRDALPVEHLHD
jgi:hypothetical protein